MLRFRESNAGRYQANISLPMSLRSDEADAQEFGGKG